MKRLAFLFGICVCVTVDLGAQTSTPVNPGNRTAGQPGSVNGEQNSRYPIGETHRPVYVSGRVVLDDGSAAPEPVLVERVCEGIARPEGYTDTSGKFHFQLGQNNAVLIDASVGSTNDPSGGFVGGGNPSSAARIGGISERDITNCTMRAVLPGFRSDLIRLDGKRAVDKPDIGLIVLHRLAKAEGFTFSMTSNTAPKDAQKAYDKGHEALKKQRLEDAVKELSKATTLYSKYAVAWYELGLAYQEQKNTEGARNAYEQAIAADPKLITPYGRLARLYATQRKWEEAADYSGKAIKLNPYVADAYFISAVAHYNLHKGDIAEEHAREAAKIDTQHRNPKINQLLGVILAERQDFQGAAENLRLYVELSPDASDVSKARQQLAEIEKRLPAAGH